MRQLRIEDRYDIDDFYDFVPQRTFYHYFPLLFAISESDQRLNYDESSPNKIFVDWLEPYYAAGEQSIGVKKVWIAPYKTTRGMDSVLYDSNFIFDLKRTLDIKNYRANIKKFEAENHKFSFLEANETDAITVIKRWYERHKESCTDFGYTLWFAKNLKLFPDIHSNIAYIKDEPVAFSLWGELDKETAIHIISKDRGIPYLQDYIRHLTYTEMLSKGFTMVNDGGYSGDDGLRRYKEKLRPEFIIPIYSWVKHE
jgi:hypothetical protein